jgi:IclR family pca regulon transcriptional regulator
VPAAADDQERPFPTLQPARYSQALERGLAILACFTPERPVLGISEIADALGISRATTHRYVSTLVAQGDLQRDSSRKYRLAPGSIELGMATLNAMGLCRHARVHLEELAKRSGYSSQIAVLDGPAILVLDTVTARRGQTKAEAGSRLPLYCTGMGKVLLAYLPLDPRAQLVSELELIAAGPNTVLGRQELEAQLDRVPDMGVAINDEELAELSCEIAAPVRDHLGDVIAAMSVSAGDGRLDIHDLLERYEVSLIAAAERLSRQLGWRASED